MLRSLPLGFLAVLVLMLAIPFADAQTTTPTPAPRHHHRPSAGRIFGFPRFGGLGLGALPFGAAGIYQQPVLIQQQPVLVQQTPILPQVVPAQFAPGVCVGSQQQFSYSGGVALTPGGCGVGVGGVGAAFAPGFGVRGRQFAPGFSRGFGVRRVGAVPFLARGILGALFGF